MQSIQFSISRLLRWKALVCEQVLEIHGIRAYQSIDSDCEVHRSRPGMEASQIDVAEDQSLREEWEPRLSTLLPASVQAKGTTFSQNNQKEPSSPHCTTCSGRLASSPVPCLGFIFCTCRDGAVKDPTSFHSRDHFNN